MRNVTKQDLERIYDKFITDPDWKIVEALIEQFIEPMKLIDDIDTKGKSADEVMGEVVGRKRAIEAMTNFLNETKLLQQVTTVTKSQFK